MRAMSPTAGEAAISSAPTVESESSKSHASASERAFAPTSETDDWDWFFAVAWAVLGPKDPGQELHYITGFPLSTCRAYVAKERASRRAPSPVFLRKLIHSPQGAPFHDAFMHGCDAQWWRDHQRDSDLAAASRRFIAEITKR